ncbi:amidohydrolase [Chloroflexi bacterium TSY]|nr:amidohydrolase [Chloroflexi bacterium TSY]
MILNNTIIDTHCHIGLYKYEPVDTLLFHMEKSGVDKAVFIQYMGNSNNGYMVECMDKYPNRFAAAMIVPSDDDGHAIRDWAERGIGGIRLPASARATCADPLAHWRTAAELGLVVSAPSNPQTLLSDEFREVCQQFHELQIVIEHLAGAKSTMRPPHTEFKQVLELAQFSNLTIKLPGFGEDLASLQALLSKRDPAIFDQIPPFADMVLEAFGPQRIMWGSDYPPASSREGYDTALQIPLSWASALSQDEQAWIFGRTAARVWKL